VFNSSDQFHKNSVEVCTVLLIGVLLKKLYTMMETLKGV